MEALAFDILTYFRFMAFLTCTEGNYSNLQSYYIKPCGKLLKGIAKDYNGSQPFWPTDKKKCLEVTLWRNSQLEYFTTTVNVTERSQNSPQIYSRKRNFLGSTDVSEFPELLDRLRQNFVRTFMISRG